MANDVKLTFRIDDDGTLSVFDTAGRKIRKVKDEVDGAGTSFSRMGASVVVANQAIALFSQALDVAQRVAGGVVRKIQEMDNIGETAKRVGLTARELSSLRLAAQQGGASLEGIARSSQFLSRQIVAASDATSKQAALFRELGVDTSRGLLPTLIQLGRVFDQLPDGADKTALAIALMGREGAAQLNVLNSTLEESIKKNEELGLTLSDETAAGAGRAADAIDEMSGALGGLGEAIAAKAAPTLTNLVGLIADVANGARSVLAGSASPLGANGQAIASLLGGAAPESASPPTLPAAVASGFPPNAGPQQPPNVARIRSILSGVDDGGRASGGGGRARASDAVREMAQQTASLDADLEDRERAINGLLEAQGILRDEAVRRAEDQLRVAQQQGASAQEQLTLAARVDTAERERLLLMKQQLETKLAAVDLPPIPGDVSEVAQLQAELQVVNDRLAESPRHVRDLQNELASAGRSADSLGDSFARAIESLQASGGKVDVSNLLRNVLQIDASDLLGQLIGGAADKFGIQGNSLTEIIGNGAKDAFQSITGLFGGGTAPAAAPSSFVGPPTAAEAAASGAGTQQAIQAGAAAGSAAAAGYAAILLAGIGALQGGFSAISKEQKRLGANQQSVLTAGAAGAVAGSFDALGFGGIGDLLSSAVTKLGGSGFLGSTLVNTTLVSPLLTGGVPDPILGALAPQIFEALGLFQPKTKGSLFKKSLASLFNEAGLPTQREFSGGGRTGVRIPSLEQSANRETFDYLQSIGLGRTGLIQDRPLAQGINANLGNYRGLREETAGVALALAPGTRGAGVFFNAIQNNFALLGQSSEEARRQLKKLASTAGIDLVGGLENLNKKFLQGKITQDALREGARGLVELFADDLPKAIDVTKIVAERTTDKGVDIAAVNAGVRGASAAFDIRERIADTRLANLDQRRQGGEIKKRIGDLDKQLLDDSLTFAQREDLLRKRADLAFQYVDYAGQRYSGQQRTREQEFGYRVAEDTAKRLEDLGKLDTANTDATNDNTKAQKNQTDVLKDHAAVIQTQTGVVQKETEAVLGLKAAIERGVRGELAVTFNGLPESSEAAAVVSQIKRELAEFVKSPEFRAAVRESAR